MSTDDWQICCGTPMSITRAPSNWEFDRMWRCYECGHHEPYDTGDDDDQL